MGAAFIENAIFPPDISNGSVGGPMFLTYVQTVQSGHEQRIAAWPYGRHFYEVNYGIKKPEQGFALLKFFHAMRGRTYGFRYLDPFDHKSCDIFDTPASNDQVLLASAVGGETSVQMIKTYNEAGQTTIRPITKPISGHTLLEINSTLRTEGVHYSVNYSTGEITLFTSLSPGDTVQGGFQFHVPCRFDVDRIPMTFTGPLISSTRVTVMEIRV